MSDIRQAIKNEIKGVSDLQSSAEAMIVEQKLNKLFYEKPNIKEESAFIGLVLSKNGYNADRAGLHASAIIASDNEFCYREQVLSLFYKQLQGDNIPVSTKRIFEEGTSIHEKWQRLLIRGGICAKENLDRTRYVDDVDLSYTPDGTNVKIGNHEYVFEIKSVNTYQFKDMKSHPSGRKQLMLYMYFERCHRGIVLAEDKNTQAFKVFLQEFDPEVVYPYLKRLKQIQVYKHEFLDTRRMVDRMPACNSSTCKRALKCNMRDACWNVGMGRVKLAKG